MWKGPRLPPNVEERVFPAPPKAKLMGWLMKFLYRPFREFAHALVVGGGWLLCRAWWLLRGPRIRKKRGELSGCKKVLVIATGYLGDVVCYIPALRAICEAMGDCDIRVLVEEGVADAVEVARLPVRVEVIPTEEWRSFWALRRWSRRLGEEGFNCALVLHYSIRAAWLAASAGIPVRVGMATRKRGFLLTHPLPDPRERHEVERNLSIPQFLGWRGRFEDRPFLRPPKETLEAVERKLARQGWEEGEPLVFVHPGARLRARRWPVERFAKVCSFLRERGFFVAVTGSRRERGLAERLVSLCGGGASLAGELSLKELCGLFVLARAGISNDTGIAHLAGACGCPVVVVWGPERPWRWAPRGSPCALVRINVPCSPCGSRPCRWAWCIREQASEHVLRALSHLERGGNGF